jgi:hypothetical protein
MALSLLSTASDPTTGSDIRHFVADKRPRTQKSEMPLPETNVASRWQGDQGPMLWSQFYAIFPNFRRKNWRFSQKPML